MSNQIEGVPEGWELVRIDKPRFGESYFAITGMVLDWTSTREAASYHPILRKIEKPKRYRPFANAAEYKPHRDRWVKYTSKSRGDTSVYLVSCYSDERVWLGPNNCGYAWSEATECLTFEDTDTPFGIEVTE